MRVFLQDFGTSHKLFICSPIQQEIDFQYNSYYNWGATSGQLHFLGDFGGELRYFIWTSKKKLIKYFCNVLENRNFMKTGEELDPALFKDAAAQEYLLIEREELRRESIYGGEFFVGKF